MVELCGIALPPDFAYLPGWFPPEPQHRGLERWLSERAAVGGHPADLGRAGHLAAESAENFAQNNVRRVQLYAGGHDGRGADVLEDALAARGIIVERRGRSWEWLHRGALVRRLPDVQAIDVSEATGLLLLPADPPEGVELEALLDAARALVAKFGPARARIDFETPRPGPRGRVGGAPWAARYGLEQPGWRAVLTRLAARVFPQHVPMLQTAIGCFEAGIDPLEEMYAGNSVIERNAELLSVLK